MKFLLVSDLHSQKSTLKYLENAVEKNQPNGIICSGDIAQFGDFEFLETFVETLNKIGLPAFIIWGNNENTEQKGIILKSKYNAHLVVRKIGDWKIIGIGDLEDMPLTQSVDWKADGSGFDSSQIKDSILITHRPPIKENLEQLLANAPRYHIHGHLHFKKSAQKYFQTTVISVSTLQAGQYAILDPDRDKVEFRVAN